MAARGAPGVLALVTLLAAAGCREDREQAAARPPGADRPAPQPPQPTQVAPQPPSPDRPTHVAPQPPATPAPPAALGPEPPGAPELDLGAPWWMSFADAQGRGVLVERIDIRSFTLPLLQPGDLVIGIDDRRVTTSEPLERYIRSVAPGSLVVLTIERDSTIHYVMLDVPGPPG